MEPGCYNQKCDCHSFSMKSEETLEVRTVTVRLTNAEDNLTDLANTFAQMGFVSGFAAEELIENIKNVIEEQYFQSILAKED